MFWLFVADLLWKLYLLFLGWLMGLQGTEDEKVDWPGAGGSLTPPGENRGSKRKKRRATYVRMYEQVLEGDKALCSAH